MSFFVYFAKQNNSSMKTEQLVPLKRTLIFALLAFFVTSCNTQSDEISEIFMTVTEKSVTEKNIEKPAQSDANKDTEGGENTLPILTEYAFIQNEKNFFSGHGNFDFNYVRDLLKNNSNSDGKYLRVVYENRIEFIENKQVTIDRESKRY
jgi:hypothetical protein